MMFHRLTLLSLALALSAMLCAPAYAQFEGSNGTLLSVGRDSIGSAPGIPGVSDAPLDALSTATLSGRTLTQDGYPLANARVELQNDMGATVASGYSNASGNFEVDNIPTGTYRLVATSGLSRASEEVDISAANAPVSLRLPHIVGKPADSAAVSIASLRVPDKAKNQLRDAKQDMSKGHNRAAQKHIDKALKIYPHYSEALAIDGILALSKHDYSTASQQVSEAIKWDSNNANAYFIMGAIFNAQKKYDDAERELNRGLALDPVSWQGHLELARTNLGKAKFAAAIKEATKAERLTAANFAPLHLLKGNAFLGMGDYPSAAAEFERYLSADKGRDPETTAQVQQRIEQINSLSTLASR